MQNNVAPASSRHNRKQLTERAGRLEAALQRQLRPRLRVDRSSVTDRSNVTLADGRGRTASGDEVEELAHAAEFFVAGLDDFFGALIGEDEELAFEDIGEEF